MKVCQEEKADRNGEKQTENRLQGFL